MQFPELASILLCPQQANLVLHSRCSTTHTSIWRWNLCIHSLSDSGPRRIGETPFCVNKTLLEIIQPAEPDQGDYCHGLVPRGAEGIWVLVALPRCWYKLGISFPGLLWKCYCKHLQEIGKYLARLLKRPWTRKLSSQTLLPHTQKWEQFSLLSL